MKAEELIRKCYDAHVEDIGGHVDFSYEEYRDFWLSHKTGNRYVIKNRNKSEEFCEVAYYPLPNYKDLRALIEIRKEGMIDFREVPVRFLYGSELPLNL